MADQRDTRRHRQMGHRHNAIDLRRARPSSTAAIDGGSISATRSIWTII